MNTTMVIVTHNEKLAQALQRLRMVDGKIVEDLKMHGERPAQALAHGGADQIMWKGAQRVLRSSFRSDTAFFLFLTFVLPRGVSRKSPYKGAFTSFDMHSGVDISPSRRSVMEALASYRVRPRSSG